MSVLDKKSVLKKDVMSIKDFARMRKISSQAVHYAIKQDFIDCVVLGYETLVVMTKKTVNYVENPKRCENGTRRERLSLKSK